jgi:hypothetical protein
MSDLFPRESAERLGSMTPARVPDIGVFEGFVRGAGMYTMRGLVQGASGIDLLGSLGPIAQDAITGGTVATDRYFREHDEIFGQALDFWTPKPREVGAAAEVAGALVSTLAQVLINPALAVTTTMTGTAEDLVKKGVDPARAVGVGAVQGAGLGLGIYMPILGQTLAQRLLLGGAGFNIVQGIGTRAASELILQGTPGEGQYHAFDPAAMTLDALLGAAFGGIVHLSPTQRAAGAVMYKRIQDWAAGLKPSDVDALAVLRQAQHLNADSMPGKPVEPVDIENHVQRVKKALEQTLRDEPVDVSDIPQPRFEADETRLADMARRARELAALAEDVRKGEGLPEFVEAYHGSPYDFERFDFSQIGTGEGVQAFGHGLYFAEHPETAGSYAAAETIIKVDGNPVGAAASGARADAAHLVAQNGGIEQALAKAEQLATRKNPIYPYNIENYNATLREQIQNLRGHEVTTENSGTLYKVEIPRRAIDEMMDWERKLKDQGDVLKKFERSEYFGKQTSGWRDAPAGLWEKNMGLRTGEDIYRDLTSRGLSEEEASAHLKTLGFHGIKYLDAGSRDAGDGTRNFVLFDASHARIVEKNGQKVVQVKTEAPAAEAGARTEPPPPRGSRPGEAAGAEAPDPVRLAAEKFVAEQPDMLLKVGDDAEGKPILKTTKEFLDEARQAAADAREDVGLFEAAAQCILGRA